MKAHQGTIVNVSSIAGALGIGPSVPSVARKGAENAMTLHLARALSPDISVNAVCPGLITTRWFKDVIGQQGDEALKANCERSTPLHRACTADDVAEAVIWLLDAARTVAGELVLLDSGMHLGAPPTVVPVPTSAIEWLPCSVRSRSTPAGVLTLTCPKQSLGPANRGGSNGR